MGFKYSQLSLPKRKESGSTGKLVFSSDSLQHSIGLWCGREEVARETRRENETTRVCLSGIGA
jgi:hypothetical protein